MMKAEPQKQTSHVLGGGAWHQFRSKCHKERSG